MDKQNEILKKKSNGFCPTCMLRGATPQPANQPCHIFSRSHKGPLFEWSNQYWGCPACNIANEHDAGFIERLHRFWKEKIGQEEWDRLDRLWHTTIQFSKHDLIELYERLNNDS